MEATVTATGAAEEFVGRFAEAWEQPTPERLEALATPDVLLVQPGMRTMRGKAAWREAVRDLLELVPDLRAEVLRWGATEDGVLIEFTLRGTLARRPFEWTLVDRIVLDGGLVKERVSYFDPLPVTLESLKAPRKLPAALRLQLRRR
jgi:ketosteroid isomerase-like protein